MRPSCRPTRNRPTRRSTIRTRGCSGSVRAVREKETSQSLDRQQPTTVQQNLPDQQVNATGAKNRNDEKQRREDITNYEVSSKTVTTTSDGFVVNKMFLAVLVNRPRLIASLGDKVSDAAIEAKVAEISQIAATAAGIDRPRGDQIQVSAVEFMEGRAILCRCRRSPLQR